MEVVVDGSTSCVGRVSFSTSTEAVFPSWDHKHGVYAVNEVKAAVHHLSVILWCNRCKVVVGMGDNWGMAFFKQLEGIVPCNLRVDAFIRSRERPCNVDHFRSPVAANVWLFLLHLFRCPLQEFSYEGRMVGANPWSLSFCSAACFRLLAGVVLLLAQAP